MITMIELSSSKLRGVSSSAKSGDNYGLQCNLSSHLEIWEISDGLIFHGCKRTV